MRWFRSLFSTSSDASMKRLVSFAAFTTAIVYTFWHPGEPKADPVTLGTWVTAGLALLGIAAFTKT